MAFIERASPVNWSTLKYMRTSPRHYRWHLEHPREDTDALLLGRVLHCLIYEPDAFDARYCVEPNFHGGMLDATARAKGYDGGKEAKAVWALEHSSHEIIPAETYESAKGMRTALLADPVAAPMLVGGKAEVPIEWEDSRTGIRCSGRVDHLNATLTDLKSSRHITPRRFFAQAEDLGYVAQLAFYADGLAALGICLDGPPALIVAQNEGPFDVAVFRLGDDVMAYGRSVYRKCLDRLAKCRESDRWPGVSDGELLDFALPAWSSAAEDDEPITMGGIAIF